MTPIQRRIRRSNTPIFSSLLSHLLYCFPPTGTHWKPEGEEIWLMQSTGVRRLGSELIMEGRQWVGGGMWGGLVVAAHWDNQYNDQGLSKCGSLLNFHARNQRDESLDFWMEFVWAMFPRMTFSGTYWETLQHSALTLVLKTHNEQCPISGCGKICINETFWHSNFPISCEHRPLPPHCPVNRALQNTS